MAGKKTKGNNPRSAQYASVQRKKAIFPSVRAASGLGGKHQGHHASAYSLTPEKIKNLLHNIKNADVTQ